MNVNILDYGAVEGGKVINTKAIQNAIDYVSQSGGGRVSITNGTFLSGTIKLKDNVELFIDEGAVLLGSPEVEDYEEVTSEGFINELLPRFRSNCFIFADGVNNISITGKGAIDCNGDAFAIPLKENSSFSKYGRWTHERVDKLTPARVVFFFFCNNVKVENITLQNLPLGWGYWINKCENVLFSNCKVISNKHYPNNDGIHVNSSKKVRIENCDLTCGDDCLIFRANNVALAKNYVCSDIEVENCRLTSYSSAIRFAWARCGTIKNVSIKNVKIYDSINGITMWLCGTYDLRRRTSDTGRENTHIENIAFENVNMEKVVLFPINIHCTDEPESQMDAITNITFKNVKATALQLPRIIGKSDNYVKNVHFEDCEFIKEKIDDGYPSFVKQEEIDNQITGIKNVENLTAKNTIGIDFNQKT